MSYDAVVLAGGTAARLGGLHKPGLRLGGRTLLERVLAAVATASDRVVVGPEQPVPPGVLVVREDPIGGGPVAALAAGLTALSAAGSSGSEVAVLAGDLPFVSEPVISALRAGVGDSDGALLLDETGRAQLLLGLWRRSALDLALATFGDPSGVPMRKLIGGLTFRSLEWTVQPGAAPPWWDCDTAEDLRRAEEWLSPEEGQ